MDWYVAYITSNGRCDTTIALVPEIMFELTDWLDLFTFSHRRACRGLLSVHGFNLSNIQAGKRHGSYETITL